MFRTIATTVLRDNFADALQMINTTNNYLLITKKGRPVSVLVNIDFFEDLLALSSNEYLDQIKEARAEYKAGKIVSHEEIFGKI